MKRSLLAIAALGLASCAATFEPAEIRPTPQRPRISKNTQTTAEDTVELEAGLAWDPNDFVDTPVTLKYGVNERMEYIIETSPLRLVEFPGDEETGIGDLAFGLRHRFDDGGDGGPAFAWEMVGKIPTSDSSDGIGTGGRDLRLPTAFSGGTDFRLAAMVEQSSGDFDFAGYGALNAIGSPVSGTTYQMLLAGHAMTPISESDSIFAEVVATFTEGVSSEFLAQAGAYRRIAANMTADAAFGLGLDRDAPAFYFLIGVSTNFGYVR